MKARTIRLVLKKKFDALLESITDSHVKELMANNSIITGGSITSMLMGEEVNDFDVYFTDKETTLAVAEYYVAKFKENPPKALADRNKGVEIFAVDDYGRVRVVVQSAGIIGEEQQDSYQYFESVPDPAEAEEFIDSAVAAVEEEKTDGSSKPKFRPVFMSSNAISLTDRVQIVIRFYGAADQIHENFDFVHCTCSWESKTGELRLPPKALESMLAKELRYKTSKYPLCSIIRTRKFLARGWRINAGQYVKMAWDLNGLDLSEISALEDQMIGVDSAYFRQVIELLKKKEGDAVDGTYLMQVLDEVF